MSRYLGTAAIVRCLELMHHRTKHIIRAVIAALCLAIAAGCGGEARAPVVLATTTSTQDSGLLEELVPAFERATGYEVKTIAVGSGEALEMGRRGEADVVLSHSPEAERELMTTGAARSRRAVMHNDFVLIGPPDDPAGVARHDAAGALAAIARRGATFISRGDDSGTHKLELALWERTGRTPGGRWYQESGQGMGATMRIANDKRAYTLTDRGTLLATQNAPDLKVLVEGDPALLNLYHVIDVSQQAGERVNAGGGRAFADWIVSPEAQRLIGAFGAERFGRPLFTPDAGRTEREIRAAD